MPKLDWDYLRDRMEGCPWSTEALEAGLWAIETLRIELGPRWPRGWQQADGTPPELALSSSHLAAFIGTLELAVVLHKVHDLPGARALRDTIRSTRRYDALMSPRLQMRIATVALSAGLDVAIEPRLATTAAPADLQISNGGVSCTVEVLAVMRDAKTLATSRWLDEITPELGEIGRRHGVALRGSVEAPLDAQETTAMLRGLEAHIALTAMGVELPDYRRGGVSVTAYPAHGVGGNLTFDMPQTAYDRRITNKLGDKVEQIRASGADWLLVDWMDNLWHMTGWGARSLAEKAHDLVALIRGRFQAAAHLQGVVITDGAVMMRPNVSEETIELAAGAGALCRQIDRWHARESVIVPLRPLAAHAGQLWRKTLDCETGWLSRELEAVGLDPLPELEGR